MYNHSDDSDIVCPLCRNNTPINSISYVKSNSEGEEPNIKIKGSFSTKIENVIIKLIELIAQDPTVKVLIFSTVRFCFFIIILIIGHLTIYTLLNIL